MEEKSFDLSMLQVWLSEAQRAGRTCVVGAVILNPQGEAFVQKRSGERRLFPGCWDIVGGHVEAGETLYDALRREIMEETGWQLTGIIALLGQFDWSFENQDRREFDLLVTVDGNLADPQLEWAKHSEFRWLKLDEIEILKENRLPADALIYEVVKKGLEYGRPDLLPRPL
jgi:8-oxo-dGTP pyrophosphatase MutT (NUDIX family)